MLFLLSAWNWHTSCEAEKEEAAKREAASRQHGTPTSRWQTIRAAVKGEGSNDKRLLELIDYDCSLILGTLSLAVVYDVMHIFEMYSLNLFWTTVAKMGEMLAPVGTGFFVLSVWKRPPHRSSLAGHGVLFAIVFCSTMFIAFQDREDCHITAQTPSCCRYPRFPEWNNLSSRNARCDRGKRCLVSKSVNKRFGERMMFCALGHDSHGAHGNHGSHDSHSSHDSHASHDSHESHSVANVVYEIADHASSNSSDSAHHSHAAIDFRRERPYSRTIFSPFRQRVLEERMVSNLLELSGDAPTDAPHVEEDCRGSSEENISMACCKGLRKRWALFASVGIPQFEEFEHEHLESIAWSFSME